jgi:hypothetical protein
MQTAGCWIYSDRNGNKLGINQFSYLGAEKGTDVAAAVEARSS